MFFSLSLGRNEIGYDKDSRRRNVANRSRVCIHGLNESFQLDFFIHALYSAGVIGIKKIVENDGFELVATSPECETRMVVYTALHILVNFHFFVSWV
jgi:hypothetical protein